MTSGKQIWTWHKNMQNAKGKCDRRKGFLDELENLYLFEYDVGNLLN